MNSQGHIHKTEAPIRIRRGIGKTSQPHVREGDRCHAVARDKGAGHRGRRRQGHSRHRRGIQRHHHPRAPRHPGQADGGAGNDRVGPLKQVGENNPAVAIRHAGGVFLRKTPALNFHRRACCRGAIGFFHEYLRRAAAEQGERDAIVLRRLHKCGVLRLAAGRRIKNSDLITGIAPQREQRRASGKSPIRIGSQHPRIIVARSHPHFDVRPCRSAVRQQNLAG